MFTNTVNQVFVLSCLIKNLGHINKLGNLNILNDNSVISVTVIWPSQDRFNSLLVIIFLNSTLFHFPLHNTSFNVSRLIFAPLRIRTIFLFLNLSFDLIKEAIERAPAPSMSM